MPSRDPVSPIQSSPRGGRIEADSSMRASAADSEGARQDASATGKVAEQLRHGGAWLLNQGAEQAEQLADSGKDQLASKLNDVAEVIQSVAGSAEEEYGTQASEYLHRAGSALSDLAQGLRTKSVDELLTDSRFMIERNRGVAVGTAALLGFAAARIAKGGQDEQRDADRSASHTVDRSVDARSTGMTADRFGAAKSGSADQGPSTAHRLKDAAGAAQDNAARLYGSATDRVSDALTTGRQQMTANPFLMVASAAAVSAGLGWLLPAGRRERRVMSEVADKLGDVGREAADAAVEAGRQKVDDVTQKALASVGGAVAQSVIGGKKSDDQGD